MKGWSCPRYAGVVIAGASKWQEEPSFSEEKEAKRL
jgi:hypothetical protein